MRVVTRSSKFIKQFDGLGDNGIVCFKFWQAVVASGCPGGCAYCFLQTQSPYRRGLYDINGTLFDNLLDMREEARRWMRLKMPAGLIVGENQDGLAFERPYKRLLGITPLEILHPLFATENPHGHTLIVLSKFTSTEFIEQLGPSPQIVMSWSLSLPSISAKYERRVASLHARLRTAERLKRAGWRIRFRLDALSPIENWHDELTGVLEQINAVGPEMLTIGALRATNRSALRSAAEKNGRDGSIFEFLTPDKDPSGFKYRVGKEFHLQAFSSVAEYLHPDIRLGLCKEDASIWRKLGLRWEGCHCLHGSGDDIAVEREVLSTLGDS